MRFAEFFLFHSPFSSVVHFWYHLFSLWQKKAFLTKVRGQTQKATRFCHVLDTQFVFI